jgi:hypothetical protein
MIYKTEKAKNKDKVADYQLLKIRNMLMMIIIIFIRR